MASIAAIRNDGRYKAVFSQDSVEERHQDEGGGGGKLLEMAYTIFKTGKKYDKDYLEVKAREKEEEK